MTRVRSVSALASVVVLSSVALLAVAGCGGRSIGDDLTGPTNPTNPTTPTDPPDPTDPTACPAIAPACDPGDRSVGSEASCAGADYCYSRTQECNKSVVWCAHDEPAQCEAIPTCDKGDKQVTACPTSGPSAGLVCYPRTLCGSTIQCLHSDACKALPQCHAGDIEVTAIDTCSKPGISCYPVSECNFTIHCYTP